MGTYGVVEPSGQLGVTLLGGVLVLGIAHSRRAVWIKRSALPLVRGGTSAGMANAELLTGKMSLHENTVPSESMVTAVNAGKDSELQINFETVQY